MSRTVQEAVEQERHRNWKSSREELSHLEEVIRALQAKIADEQEESSIKFTRMRNKYEDILRKRVERIRYEINEEMNEKFEQLKRRHREEVSNRQRLYEDEIRTLLRELDRLRGSKTTYPAVSDAERKRSPSSLRSPRYPTPSKSIRTPRQSFPSSPGVLRSSGSLADRMVESKEPIRSQLSRQYASQLDSYLKKNRDVVSPTKLATRVTNAKQSSSPLHSSRSNRYRFPTPPEYDAVYRGQRKSVSAEDEDRYPRDSLDISVRLPTPPEYRRFYAQNTPDEDEVDVDASESALDDRISVYDETRPL